MGWARGECLKSPEEWGLWFRRISKDFKENNRCSGGQLWHLLPQWHSWMAAEPRPIMSKSKPEYSTIHLLYNPNSFAKSFSCHPNSQSCYGPQMKSSPIPFAGACVLEQYKWWRRIRTPTYRRFSYIRQRFLIHDQLAMNQKSFWVPAGNKYPVT